MLELQNTKYKTICANEYGKRGKQATTTTATATALEIETETEKRDSVSSNTKLGGKLQLNSI